MNITNDNFDSSDLDVIEFYIRCDNEVIFCDCLRKIFSMGYYWWCDRSQRVNQKSYDKYIVCYSGDESSNIPLNIAVGDSDSVKIDSKILNGVVWLRKEKLEKIEDR